MHVGFAINLIQTAKYRKYMHIDLANNVVQTAKNRKYMHIDFAINVIQTAKNRKYMHKIVRVLYGKTIDVILTAVNQSYVRIKKRTVNAPCSP